MPSTLRTFCLLVAAGLVLGTVANLVSPHRIAWIGSWSDRVTQRADAAGLRVVDLATTRQLVQAGTHLVFDARPAEAFQSGHLPGAISLPWQDVEQLFTQYAGLLTPDTAVLVYCSGADCEESIDLGMRLHGAGFTNVVLFAGGYTAWQSGVEAGP